MGRCHLGHGVLKHLSRAIQLGIHAKLVARSETRSLLASGFVLKGITLDFAWTMDKLTWVFATLGKPPVTPPRRLNRRRSSSSIRPSAGNRPASDNPRRLARRVRRRPSCAAIRSTPEQRPVLPLSSPRLPRSRPETAAHVLSAVVPHR